MEGLRIDHTTLPSPLPGSPSFIFHLTHLTNTLLLWIGTGQPTDPADPTAVITPVERKLAQDWAVAMPSTRVCGDWHDQQRRRTGTNGRTCLWRLRLYTVEAGISPCPCLNDWVSWCGSNGVMADRTRIEAIPS